MRSGFQRTHHLSHERPQYIQKHYLTIIRLVKVLNSKFEPNSNRKGIKETKSKSKKKIERISKLLILFRED